VTHVTHFSPVAVKYTYPLKRKRPVYGFPQEKSASRASLCVTAIKQINGFTSDALCAGAG